MRTLEELINDLATRGKISHISLAMDSDSRNWRAVYAASTGANVHGIDANPVKALRLALAGTPKAAARVAKPGDPRAEEPDTDDLEDFG